MANVSHRSASDKPSTVVPFRRPRPGATPDPTPIEAANAAFERAHAMRVELETAEEKGRAIPDLFLRSAHRALTDAFAAMEQAANAYRMEFRNQCWFDSCSHELAQFDRHLDLHYPERKLAEVVRLPVRRRSAQRKAVESVGAR